MFSLDWTEDTTAVPEAGLERRRTVSADDCRALAETLAVSAIDSMSATYRISAKSSGRYRLDGRITARVVQPCVVTLDPVTQTIDEPLSFELWPADQIPKEERTEVEVDLDDAPEPYSGTTLPVGRLVYEVLAAAIEPFPRSENAELDATATPEPAKQSPFAVLATLKTPKET